MLIKSQPKPLLNKEYIQSERERNFEKDMAILQNIESTYDVGSNSFEIKRIILAHCNNELLPKKYKDLFIYILDHFKTYEMKEFNELYESDEFYNFCMNNQDLLCEENDILFYRGFQCNVENLIMKLIDSHVTKKFNELAKEKGYQNLELSFRNSYHSYYEGKALGDTGGYLDISIFSYSKNPKIQLKLSLNFPLYSKEFAQYLQSVNFNENALKTEILIPLSEKFKYFTDIYTKEHELIYINNSYMFNTYFTNNDCLTDNNMATFMFDYHYAEDLPFNRDLKHHIEVIIERILAELEVIKPLHKEHIESVNQLIGTVSEENNNRFLTDNEITRISEEYVEQTESFDDKTKHFAFVSMLHIFDEMDSIRRERFMPRENKKGFLSRLTSLLIR